MHAGATMNSLFVAAALFMAGVLVAAAGSGGPADKATTGAPSPDSERLVPWGFESGVWKGIELSTNHVKTGKCSGLWKDRALNKSISADKIAHDWSGFEEMRLWIYAEQKSVIPMMIVLVSRADPTVFSYFSHRLTVDWEGWQEVRLPFSSFDGMRAPAGWQQIDSVMFTVEGWGMQSDPNAVLDLDGLALLKPAIKTLSAEQTTDLNLIKNQFRDYQRESWKTAGGPAADDESAAAWMKSLAADGTWPDVNYADQTGGSWRTMEHLNRINTMCLVYTSPECKLRGDPALSKTIHAALGHWLKNDYRNPNWWNNEIGVPRELAIIMLFLDAELSPQERATGSRIVSRAVIDSPPHGGRGALTGQNRVWVAGNALLHGLLAADYALVQQARNVIFAEVVVATQPGGIKPGFNRTGKPGEVLVTTQEGIQPDFSFFQHGPQLQLGNYGLAFAGDIVMWMAVLRGASLAMDPEQVGIIRNYLLKGESAVIWKGAVDINSCGRQLGPRSPIGKGVELLGILGTAKAADASHASNYQAAIEQGSPDASARIIPPTNKYFWRSDFMVHRRPEYYVSTRMSSSRVLASEVVNGENLQGGYLGDGATYVYLTGHEYEGIFAVWDWSRLPGVTSPRITDKNLLKPRNWSVTNHGDFVGGVSDGCYGAAVLELNRDGLTARKGWFYFDDQIVCLGAGITGDRKDLFITTSVNQCLARGDVTVEAGTGATVPPAGRKEYATLKWAWHDNVGYVFPEPQQITLGSQEQTGGWNEVTARAMPTPVTQKVFSIWINHGAGPRDAHYSYLILPGASPVTLQAQAGASDITILQNTSSLQAVRHAKLKVLQAVFHRPGTLAYADGKTIAVDKPCVLLLVENTNRLTLADPTQTLAAITVTRNGAAVRYTLPSGAQAGASFTTP